MARKKAYGEEPEEKVEDIKDEEVIADEPEEEKEESGKDIEEEEAY